MISLSRRLLAEGLGSLLLAATVVGSGVMAEHLSQGNGAVALLANTGATVAVLATLIALLGPVSGAHFNPAVSAIEAVRGRLPARTALAYCAVQVLGCCAGALLAHAMFQLPFIQASTHVRTGASQWLSEGVATCGLLLVVLGHRRRLLVYGVNVIRKPCDHDGPLINEYVFWDPARGRSRFHRQPGCWGWCRPVHCACPVAWVRSSRCRERQCVVFSEKVRMRRMYVVRYACDWYSIQLTKCVDYSKMGT